tara:strand:- start:7 stop:396 length:390 start_codon:yes stop_codon:yes gene_type:complete
LEKLIKKDFFMKLVKYIINLIILSGTLIFLFTLNGINETADGQTLLIKIPLDLSGESFQEFPVWIIVLGMLTIGVLLGFFIALFQILSQKGELVSMKSKLKRLQVEIDTLRNESIDEDIELNDTQIEDN